MSQPADPSRWLKTFFEEKALDSRTYETEVNGNLHIIDTETVIDLIQKAPKHEQLAIIKILSEIDFRNGDVHDFMRHLAQCFARTHYSQ